MSLNKNGESAAAVYELNPLEDSRWRGFLESHPSSSAYHTVEWLDALRRTYGYEPIAFTTSPPTADLQNATVFCNVESCLTGRRLVSLPFSDHCDVLVDSTTDLTAVLGALEGKMCRKKLRYVEIRPTHPLDPTIMRSRSSMSYCIHQLDLRPDLDTLFKNCHKNSTQRKIRRAQREDLEYKEGQSASVLNSFYSLLLLTRRRHRIPPQPKRWFENLIGCFGKALKIRVAYKNEQPVASILTLQHKGTLLYKYGCSDARFHNLGGMHFLLWNSIGEAKQDGLRAFDLGRSDWENPGLIAFKDRWGATRSVLTYLRLLASPQSKDAFIKADADWKHRSAKSVFPHLTDGMLRAAGELIYRHIG